MLTRERRATARAAAASPVGRPGGEAVLVPGDAGYVPKTLFEEWERKDPIRLFESELKSRRLVDALALKEMESGIESELDEAVAWAERQPYPEPEECLTGVYHE